MPLTKVKFLPFKILVAITLFMILYAFLPVFLVFRISPFAKIIVPVFYLFTVAITIIVIRKSLNNYYAQRYQAQEAQEKINILKEENQHLQVTGQALKYKRDRYGRLKEIIEELNRNLDLDYVGNALTSIAYSLVGNNKGTCLLYLVDTKTQKLSLYKSKKEEKLGAIKAKEGTLVDFWMIKHSNPLLIEDIRNDFRFDLNKLVTEDTRTFSSLVGAPLLSGHNLIGLLRLDSLFARSYSQDDLRFLATICELGAVALENATLFSETQELAIHDGLTQLYTKNHFLGRLKEECSRSMRSDQPFSMLMADIDFFKKYNDEYGHTAGDIVLKRISQIMQESLKKLNPLIARFGGEEFCVIIPHADRKKAFELAESLRARVESEKIILRRQETRVTVSIGVATFPDDGKGEEELIQRSDKAMYAAKQKGRNRVCCI